jgi:hypothetical protein
MAASMVSSSPPTSVQARPVDDADLVLVLDLAVAYFGTPRYSARLLASTLADLSST